MKIMPCKIFDHATFLGQRNWNHFVRVEIQIQQAINNR
jgi:hypothetical protein